MMQVLISCIVALPRCYAMVVHLAVASLPSRLELVSIDGVWLLENLLGSRSPLDNPGQKSKIEP